VESFLKEGGEEEFTLPRRRSLLFYLAATLVVLFMLALLAGAGYLVYRAAWGGEKAGEPTAPPEDDMATYVDPELGFSLDYYRFWSLEELPLTGEELTRLRIYLSDRKSMELSVYRMDPVVLVGGLEAIKEELVADAVERITSRGGEVPEGVTDASGVVDPAAELFTPGFVRGAPSYYTEFEANYMGEDTDFLLYYVVGSDILFVFEGRSPAVLYQDEVRPQFFAIIGSLRLPEEESPAPAVESALPRERRERRGRSGTEGTVLPLSADGRCPAPAPAAESEWRWRFCA
jgi:hypothetical protein